MSAPKKILFVCLGNIIRSPLAENLFRQLAEQGGMGERYLVDSAGTSSYHIGESPDARMRRTAADRGLDYDGSARQVRPEDFERFDLIVAMDETNYRDLSSITARPEQRKKIRLLREFDPQSGSSLGVPDPYYGGPEGFERTYDIVERSVEGLLQALEAEKA